MSVRCKFDEENVSNYVSIMVKSMDKFSIPRVVVKEKTIRIVTL
jgi:hypothetical protein